MFMQVWKAIRTPLLSPVSKREYRVSPCFTLLSPFFYTFLSSLTSLLSFALAFALDRKVLTWKGGVGCLKPDRGETNYYPQLLILKD